MIEHKSGTSQWVPLTYAARECQVSLQKIQNVVKKHQLEIRKNPRDDRSRLVDLTAVKHIMGITEEGQ